MELSDNRLTGPFPAWLLSDTTFTNGTTLMLQARSSLAFLVRSLAEVAHQRCPRRLHPLVSSADGQLTLLTQFTKECCRGLVLCS